MTFKSTTTTTKVDEEKVEKPVWTEEEFAELREYYRDDDYRTTIPIGITAKEIEKIK